MSGEQGVALRRERREMMTTKEMGDSVPITPRSLKRGGGGGGEHTLVLVWCFLICPPSCLSGSLACWLAG